LKETHDTIHANDPWAIWIAKHGGPKVVAAAPDLLEACTVLADYYKGHEYTDDQAAKEAGGGVYRALLAARIAIAKATK
jgi:hypothetical protein